MPDQNEQSVNGNVPPQINLVHALVLLFVFVLVFGGLAYVYSPVLVFLYTLFSNI